MSELTKNINEYIQNSQEIIGDLQKEASDYKSRLADVERRPLIEKEAAITVAGTLIGKGLISANDLSQTIDDLCADPLGVIAKISKVASVQTVSIPSMGMGCSKKSGPGVISTENLSNADKALLTSIHLI